MNLLSLLTDVLYARGQVRQAWAATESMARERAQDCLERALDALERMEEALESEQAETDRQMPEIISNLGWLRLWVHEHLPANHPYHQCWTVAERIAERPDRPEWGQDWQPWLETLPSDLFSLLEGNQ